MARRDSRLAHEKAECNLEQIGPNLMILRVLSQKFAARRAAVKKSLFLKEIDDLTPQ